MSVNHATTLDPTDRQIVRLLQENARLSLSALGRLVQLSPPAVTERVRRLEAAGVIRGYHAEADLAALGLPIMAIIRMIKHDPYGETAALQVICAMPEIVECHRVTGDDCFVLKVVVGSIEHLDQVINRLAPHGSLTTSLVLGTPLQRHTLG